ncbi:sodium:solute symporter family protein [Synechococcus sp. CS-197]|uniref:sodium:solute symporter family protein n=1 Tax=Synechococcus sp. CS-197 TaxID=2847985 RepID=UPI00015257AB|nr:sodium:solute symporter family protein [Synechococcus sp. CS-197]MCT0251161.1 Na+:solute symporter [Synechococcus sp. CS-197]CAK24483.1 Sodium:solute symporter family, possible glucose transporter [Synechococcus sp. WH 7803]
MARIDWLILVAYLASTLVLGLWLARRNRDEDDYFVAGRRLSGWLAGASMAATTFSIDTPLYVAGIVGTRGLAANWEWWGFGLAHVAMAVVFAPLWRRSGVLTDAAFTELRYGGAAAAWLRGIKAFLLALPVNCIGIGYAFLAMRKVVGALGIVSDQPVPAAGGVSDTLLLLIIVAALVLAYTVAGGLWAVVITDFIQLILALLGAAAVAWAAVHAAGGMGPLLEQLEALGRPELLSIVPWRWEDNGFNWIGGAGISVSTFLAYLTVQWWSFRRSDGGGEFIQRMLATRNEQEARLAGWVFLVVNYLVRSWLWVLVALAALVLLPDQADWELSYPTLAVQFLPPVVLGLVVVSLVAAFMSTVSTSVNWGASYLTHDLYQRFLRPNASQRELLLVGQLMSVILLVLGVITALISDSIGTVFRLVIAIGTGPGVVLVLRWFWWRINAAAELAAMLCGFVVGLLTSVVPLLQIADYGQRLMVTTGLTALVWLTVMLLTPPESPDVLERFVQTVRPPGPGWDQWRRRWDVQAAETLSTLLARFLFSSGILFGALLGSGAFLLHQQVIGWMGLVVAAISLLMLRRTGRAVTLV